MTSIHTICGSCTLHRRHIYVTMIQLCAHIHLYISNYALTHLQCIHIHTIPLLRFLLPDVECGPNVSATYCSTSDFEDKSGLFSWKYQSHVYIASITLLLHEIHQYINLYNEQYMHSPQKTYVCKKLYISGNIYMSTYPTMLLYIYNVYIYIPFHSYVFCYLM